MKYRPLVRIAALSLMTVSVLLVGSLSLAREVAVALPDPKLDPSAATATGEQTAVFAGGCFWGVEAVFRHVKGVRSAVSGYAGGSTVAPSYEDVSSGTTGHAETVSVRYDPAQVSYAQLLKVFMSVAHNPTELNRQGPDHGTQYRSAIFYTNAEQQKIAAAYIEKQNPPQPPAMPGGTGSWNFLDIPAEDKDADNKRLITQTALKESSDSVTDKMARDALNEFRSATARR